MLNLFKKNKEEKLSAPCRGVLIPLSQVHDTMFAEKLLGDGFAIIPEDDVIYAPTDGIITMIANTAHAFGITTSNGAEILVHVGLDTVALNGKGFEILVSLHQKVKARTPIIKLDLLFMKRQNVDMTIPVILVNGDNYRMQGSKKEGKVCSGDEILDIIKK